MSNVHGVTTKRFVREYANDIKRRNTRVLEKKRFADDDITVDAWIDKVVNTYERGELSERDTMSALAACDREIYYEYD